VAVSYVTRKNPTTQPRAVAIIYGRRVVPISARVTYASQGMNDTASLELGNDFDWSTFLKSPTNDGEILVEVYAGFPVNPPPNSTDVSQLQRIFLGCVQHYDIDEPDDVWKFECSSLATLLMAEKQTTLVANQTTTQFIEAIAKAKGLKTDIRLAPRQQPATVQQVLAQDFVVGVKNIRPWSMFAAFAQVDDVELSIRFDTVRYWSHIYGQRPKWPIAYGADLVTVKGTHSPQFNKNIQVEVRSYQQRVSYSTRYGPNGAKSKTTVTTPVFGSGASITTTSDGTMTSHSTSGGFFNSGALSIPSSSSKERVVLHADGLTKDQADAFALAEWKRRSRQEYRISVSLPVTPALLKVLDQDLAFVLSGHPSDAFNSSSSAPEYRQQRTVQTISIADGYNLEMDLINHQLDVETAI
jgi:hypothetical protein